jgi:hypothetical protein
MQLVHRGEHSTTMCARQPRDRPSTIASSRIPATATALAITGCSVGHHTKIVFVHNQVSQAPRAVAFDEQA